MSQFITNKIRMCLDNNNVNKLTNKKEIMRDELAIELMEKLDKKYNMSNVISLDEYVYEYYNVLTANEKTKCFEIIEIK